MRVEAKMGSDVVLRIPCPEFEGVSSNERVHVGFESKIFKVRTARDADVRVVIEERQEPVRTCGRWAGLFEGHGARLFEPRRPCVRRDARGL